MAWPTRPSIAAGMAAIVVATSLAATPAAAAAHCGDNDGPWVLLQLGAQTTGRRGSYGRR
jgi:hypothetical protein